MELLYHRLDTARRDSHQGVAVGGELRLSCGGVAGAASGCRLGLAATGRYPAAHPELPFAGRPAARFVSPSSPPPPPPPPDMSIGGPGRVDTAGAQLPVIRRSELPAKSCGSSYWDGGDGGGSGSGGSESGGPGTARAPRCLDDVAC